MTSLYELPGPAAQDVLRHLDPWGRTQAALALKPWSRLGTLPARKLVLVGSQFDASPQCLAQLAAAAPGAKHLQLYLDPATPEGTVSAILECLGGRTCLTTLVIVEASPLLDAPPTASLWGPSLHHVAPHLTSFTLHMSHVGPTAADLRHLLSCDHLTHVSLTGAYSNPGRRDGVDQEPQGLDAAGLLVVAQLRPLTSAELLLDVQPSRGLSLEQLLAAPAVAPVAEEVLQIKEEFGWPLNLGWVALKVFQRRHGSSLRRLALSGCSASMQLAWGGPWDMPHLEHYSGDNKIQLDFEEVPSAPACSSSLTSLQLGQQLNSSSWEQLPALLPNLQQLELYEQQRGRGAPENHWGAVMELQAAMQGRPVGMDSLASLVSLTSLRWGCWSGATPTWCAKLTQLRDLEVLLEDGSHPVPYTVQLGVFGDLEQLTRLRISGLCAWSVEETSWWALGGKLPHLKDLHLAAQMGGRIPQLPGTGLQSLRLDARAGFKHALQLASSALPPSLTRLQLSGVAVTDSFGQALQITPHGVPWAGPTLQLPQLKELLLGGVSTSTPGTAFSASPVTRLQLLLGLPGSAFVTRGAEEAQLPVMEAVCQGLPLLQELHIDGSSRDAAAAWPWLTGLTALKQLARLHLEVNTLSPILSPPEEGPLLATLPHMPHLTRLDLVETGSSAGPAQHFLVFREALQACKSLRVLQLHAAGMPWSGVDGSSTAVGAVRSQPAISLFEAFLDPQAMAGLQQQNWGNYVALQQGLVNCVVLPFRQPRCGQL